MFRNYLKTAWRNVRKNRIFSVLNILGLAIGLSCFLLIVLYVVDELRFDRFHDKADRIFRIHSDIRFGGSDLTLTVSPDPMGAALKNDYPQVEAYTRIYNSNGAKLIRKGNQYITEQNVSHADSTFFDVFTFPAVVGNTKTALNEPNTVVVTESAAKKYFGTHNAIGKILEADRHPYKITAVIKDMPRQSHFQFDFLFSMDNVDYQWGNFLSNNFSTYIVLKSDTDYKSFEKNFSQVIERYLIPQAKQFMEISNMDEFIKAGNKLQYSLMPLTDIHLYSDRFPEFRSNGNIQYVYIFSAVAIFVLLVACINFMNLSTAHSANRAKEVGIRKVLGTQKKALIAQFLVESTVMVLIALVIAMCIAYLVLPLFNDIAAKEISLLDLLNAPVLVMLILLPFAVGILAGIYPALFLSRFKPITVLKGNANTRFKKSSLRSALVIFQFVTSIILIIGTIIVYSQLNYIQTKNLGFNKDQVLIIDGTGALQQNAQAFKNEVMGLQGVNSGTYSGFLPVSSARNDISFSKTPVIDVKNGLNMQRWTVDYDYIKTLGIQIIRGRNFSKEFGSDSLATIINETAAQILGYDDPIGKKLYAYDDVNNPVTYEIIGVVKNFHFESLRQNIAPMSMMLGNSTWTASFKVNTADIRKLVSSIESIWKKMAPGMPFSYRFMDESFDEMYRSEQRVGKVAISFAILTIIIACLGLFGLVTYAAEQRVKEIGIRKVLGATIINIVNMLSRDFLKLVFIALLIATPIAWWAMHQWLEDFAFRINISWWVFVIAGGAALIIALATVSVQAIKAARTNPVKNLRSE
jgi:putative ABC transport system permease protein